MIQTFVLGQNVIFISFSCHQRSQMVPIPFLSMSASVQTSKNRTSPAALVPAWTTKLCFRMWREPRGFRSAELPFSSSQLSNNFWISLSCWRPICDFQRFKNSPFWLTNYFDSLFYGNQIKISYFRLNFYNNFQKHKCKAEN